MGLAIIFVILFHVGLPREDAFFGLKRMGNIGVDFFLFLSGMGLWFSWTKHPSLRSFIFAVSYVSILLGFLWLVFTIYPIFLTSISQDIAGTV